MLQSRLWSTNVSLRRCISRCLLVGHQTCKFSVEKKQEDLSKPQPQEISKPEPIMIYESETGSNFCTLKKVSSIVSGMAFLHYPLFSLFLGPITDPKALSIILLNVIFSNGITFFLHYYSSGVVVGLAQLTHTAPIRYELTLSTIIGTRREIEVSEDEFGPPSVNNKMSTSNLSILVAGKRTDCYIVPDEIKYPGLLQKLLKQPNVTA